MLMEVPTEKKIWQSKTMWTGLIVSIAAFFPPIRGWIVANPEAFSSIIGAVILGLRIVTKDAIYIYDDSKNEFKP